MKFTNAVRIVHHDASGFRVELSSGRIQLDAADLLRVHGEPLIRMLIAGAMRHSAVLSVLVDRNRGKFTISYDRVQRMLSETLIEISHSLCDVRARGDSEAIVPIGPRVDRGTVIRVDRSRYIPLRERIKTETKRPARPLPVRPRGVSRVVKLAAAGGCFSLAMAGLAVPGIPTLTCCIASSYLLVRSSPRLNERLRNSYSFGSLVRDFEDHGGMRASVKSQAIFQTLLAGGAAILMSRSSLAILAMSVGVAIVDLWVVLRLPTIPEGTLT